MKISDFIVEFLIEKGVTDVFGYPGGMVTHLMESFSKYEDKISAHVNYHEQASSFAACGYAQASGKIGVAYATSGPGATNMMTGICNAYFDSVPVLFITGQVNTFESRNGLGIRQNGFQETDVIQMVKDVTKYAAYIERPEDIRYELEKAYAIAMSGRRGPVVLDIPMNIQRTDIDVATLRSYEEVETEFADVSQITKELCEMIKSAKRPCLLLGAGMKPYKKLVLEAVEKMQLPVVCSMPAMDILPSDLDYYFGFIGAYGTRVANFLLAKSDLVIAIGSRLDIRQIGARKEGFAENAKLVRIDIDADELGRKVKEEEVSYQLDGRLVLESILAMPKEAFEEKQEWLATCQLLKEKLAGIDEQDETNYIRKISQCLPDNCIITTDVGQNQVWVAQAFEVKEHQSILFSSGHGAMGYSLPAAIGAYYGSGKPVVSINGDGGVQMNIQELQFIAREQLPIMILIINNQALGMIRHFQEMYFESNYTQTKAAGGYTTPDFVAVAKAYGVPAYRVSCIEEITEALRERKRPVLIEVVVDKDTYVSPKLVYGQPNQDQDPPLDRTLYQELMEL